MGDKEITIEIKRPEIIFLIILLCAVLILEIFVTFPSPIAFGDEGFHTRLAQYISKEREYPSLIPFFGTKLVKETYSRPPLWNLLESSFFFIFGFKESIVKFLTPFIGSILIGLSVFLVVKKIYNREIGFIASVITVTIPSLVTYSILFYTDSLFTFYFTLFVLTYILAIKFGRIRYWIMSGIFGSFSLLTKDPGFSIFILLLLGFFYQIYRKENLKKLFKNYFIVILLIMLIYGSFILRNIVYYKTPSCSLPYFNKDGCRIVYEYKKETEVSRGREASIFETGLINYFDFAYGNIWFVLLGLICGLVVLGSRKQIQDIFVIFVIVSFLPIFYISIGRGEDTARYTLGIVPIIAIIAANYFEKIYDFIKNYYKVLAIIVFIFVISFGFFNLNEKLKGARYLDKNTGQYLGFKMFSPSFFEATNFIKKNVSEDVLIMTVWDYATVYNTQRNVVGLRTLPDSDDIISATDLNLTLSRLEVNDIDYLFVQKFSINNQYYPPNFVQFLENNPKSFVKIYENGPSVEECISTGNCDGNILYQINYN